MFKNLEKKLKTFAEWFFILTTIVCVCFIGTMIYNTLNSGSLTFVSSDGSVTRIPWLLFTLVALFLYLIFYLFTLSLYSLGDILEMLREGNRMIVENRNEYEKEQLSKMVSEEENQIDDNIPPSGQIVLDSVNDPVIINKQLFRDDTPKDDIQKEIEKDLEDGVADYLVTNKFEDTMEIENKKLFEDVDELPNYRLELSTAFFDRIKPVKLTSTQERAVYENVELALLTNEYLILTTTTEEGQKVNISIPTDTLDHVADNIETYKDALKIFRKLKTIQVAKDFIWRT